MPPKKTKTPTSELERQALSVSELNLDVKLLLEESYSGIWICGELSNFSAPQSGHWYFSLKDNKAQIRGAMFRFNNRLCKFSPKSGDQVLVKGRVSLYEPRGDYQIIVDEMQPAGAGALQQAFEQLKRKLNDQGLFDEEHKKTLPPYPNHIGVITSPTGAAIRDILQVLKRRFPIAPVIIYPCSVQGDAAKKEICAALKQANRHKQCDLIIFARGGGSIEDLWSFNEESVAKAIFQSKIPIITGIGHQIDFTIADFIADVRAPTPSAAAELATPDQNELYENFRSFEHWFSNKMSLRITNEQRTLAYLTKQLIHPRQRIEALYQRLDELTSRLKRSKDITFKQKREAIKALSVRFAQCTPKRSIHEKKIQTNHFTEKLTRNMRLKLANAQKEWELYSSRLHCVSPLATLERGYSITRTSNGELLTTAKQVTKDNILTTQIKDGTIKSRVI